VLAAGDSGPDLGVHLCFTLCWNEFIYALNLPAVGATRTVAVAIVNEFCRRPTSTLGSLMAGASRSLPLVILYAFFVGALCVGHDRRVKE